ncbi:hypothetical protein GIB67_039827 [Kingdonia uniflora]|uniref:MADS-box domain-containing protein n=1 Tax=Kingdonia uniflora TaxID=39325 RepID=A0A7J7P345_9MAGN|nr:hypothetical protein GIB67_039827 [Kingdonia uniflora]
MAGKPRSKGRQRVEMKPIEENNARKQVTFSKRKHGLFKKASELCVLCGAQVVIIVFSPANKAYSIGIPDFNMLVDRFLSGAPAPPSLGFAPQIPTVRELAKQLTELMNELEVQEKRAKQLAEISEESEEKYWWEKPIEKLELSELMHLQGLYEELRRKVAERADKLLISEMALAQASMPNIVPLPGLEANPIVRNDNPAPQVFSFRFGEN